jgi:DNA-directed RNA polymerase subunit K/omega
MSDYSESEHSDSESETEEVLPLKKKVTKEKDKDSDEEGRVSETSDSDNDDDSVVSSVNDDDDDIELSDDDDEEDGMNLDDAPPAEEKKVSKKSKKQKAQEVGDDDDASLHLGELVLSDDEDADEEDEDGSQYLHQFDEQVKEQLIANHHPELMVHNYDEVEALTHVTRDVRGIIIDPLHRTLPFLTKYEKTRILGERAKQLNGGAKSFIDTNPTIIDGYLIAHAELEQKKIPFIIRRPLNNGGSEYWKLSDLEII